LYGGLAAIVTGYSIIYCHNVWDGSWRVVITVIGGLALLKGLLLIVFPGIYKGLKNTGFLEKYLLILFIPLTLLLGAFFGYFGFLSS